MAKKKETKVDREHTVILVKPDGIKRGLMGEIVSRFERVGLKIVAMKMVWVDEELAKKHYPTSRKKWLENIGKRTLETYEEYGRDPGEDLDTMSHVEIGKKMANWLVDYLTSGPVVAMIIEGENAILTARKIVGHTFGDKATPGTIRGDYSRSRGYAAYKAGMAGHNLIHSSGNAEEAKFEEELWFRKNEIHSYKRLDEDMFLA